MDANDLTKLKDAFNQWAQNHDAPDEPAVFIGGKTLSPCGYAAEIQNETPLGRDIIDSHARLMKHNGQTIDEVCAWINPPKP